MFTKGRSLGRPFSFELSLLLSTLVSSRLTTQTLTRILNSDTRCDPNSEIDMAVAASPASANVIGYVPYAEGGLVRNVPSLYPIQSR